MAHGIGQSDANGMVVGNAIQVVATESMTGAFGSITIPRGTVMKDAAGHPLTGQIEVMVVYHNNQTEQSLLSFPGGFFVT